MLTGKVLIPVKVVKPLGDWHSGDVVLVEDWKARELWESGIVEIVDESDKVIGEIDKVMTAERESEPLTVLPEGLYERAEFYAYYLENYVRLNPRESVDTINVKLTKLANLKKKLRDLKLIRFNKILKAVMLRPNSLELLSRLAPEERRIYLQMSKIRNEWLGDA
jgi:DNA replication factor GINS